MKTPTITYQGTREGDNIKVTVTHAAKGPRPQQTADLSPEPSRRIHNHSPDGFNWGYNGSGPAQLALAILLHYFGNLPIEQRPAAQTAPRLAEQFYQEFKAAFIAPILIDSWMITDKDIAEWLAQHIAEAAH